MRARLGGGIGGRILTCTSPLLMPLCCCCPTATPQSTMGGKSAARLIHKHNENNPNNYPM